MAKKKINHIDSALMSELIVAGMQEKKAEDIVILDLRKVPNAITDFFVISSVNSENQADAVLDSIEEVVFNALQTNPIFREGKDTKEWVILDYFDVVAHVFKKSRREFYNLEKLWADAEFKHIENA